MGRCNLLGGQSNLLGGQMPTQLTCYLPPCSAATAFHGNSQQPICSSQIGPAFFFFFFFFDKHSRSEDSRCVENKALQLTSLQNTHKVPHTIIQADMITLMTSGLVIMGSLTLLGG